MANLFLIMVLTASLAASFAWPRNRPPVAVDDQYFILYHPVPVVEIPVLENDTDPDGDVLQVTALPAIEGGKAEIVDGTIVRVYIDWSQQVPDDFYGLMARGTYAVSDGMATRYANWAVWYFPEIPPIDLGASTEGGN